MERISEKIQDLRIEKGLSIRQLAKEIKITPVAISRWENKKRLPSAEALVSLAKFFGVTTDYLLGLED